jgi:hypothetical protein
VPATGREVRVGDAHEDAGHDEDGHRDRRREPEREQERHDEDAAHGDAQALHLPDGVREPVPHHEDPEGEAQTPRREPEAEGDDVEPQEDRRVAEDDEEHDVVRGGDDGEREERGLAEEAEHLADLAGSGRRRRCPRSRRTR